MESLVLSEVGCLLFTDISLFDQVTSSVLVSMGFAACFIYSSLPCLVDGGVFFSLVGP